MKVVLEHLDNGIPVVLVPMSHFHTHTQLVMVRGGSRYETAEVSGISHLLEHMMFKGTTNRPKAEDIAIEVETMSGHSNAFTDKEEIGFYIYGAPLKYFENITDILSDQLLCSVINQEDLKCEKSAVLEELNMRAANPLTAVSDLLPRLIYGDQAAGRDAGGTPETVKAAARRQLVSYMNRYFVKTNMVIACAGKIPNQAEIMQILNRQYADVSAMDEANKYAVKPTGQKEPQVMVKHMDIPQTYVALASRCGGLKEEKDIPVLSILNNILGSGMSSRLFLEVREKRGLAYFVGSYLDLQSDAGNFVIRAGIASKRLEEALTVIRQELKKMAEEPIPAEEIQKAKNISEGDFNSILDNPTQIASSAAKQLLTLGRIKDMDETLKAIKKVTAQDIQNLASRIFANSGLNLVVLGPHQEKEKEHLKSLMIA